MRIHDQLSADIKRDDNYLSEYKLKRDKNPDFLLYHFQVATMDYVAWERNYRNDYELTYYTEKINVVNPWIKYMKDKYVTSLSAAYNLETGHVADVLPPVKLRPFKENMEIEGYVYKDPNSIPNFEPENELAICALLLSNKQVEPVVETIVPTTAHTFSPYDAVTSYKIIDKAILEGLDNKNKRDNLLPSIKEYLKHVLKKYIYGKYNITTVNPPLTGALWALGTVSDSYLINFAAKYGLGDINEARDLFEEHVRKHHTDFHNYIALGASIVMLVCKKIDDIKTYDEAVKFRIKYESRLVAKELEDAMYADRISFSAMENRPPFPQKIEYIENSIFDDNIETRIPDRSFFEKTFKTMEPETSVFKAEASSIIPKYPSNQMSFSVNTPESHYLKDSVIKAEGNTPFLKTQKKSLLKEIARSNMEVLKNTKFPDETEDKDNLVGIQKFIYDTFKPTSEVEWNWLIIMLYFVSSKWRVNKITHEYLDINDVGLSHIKLILRDKRLIGFDKGIEDLNIPSLLSNVKLTPELEDIKYPDSISHGIITKDNAKENGVTELEWLIYISLYQHLAITMQLPHLYSWKMALAIISIKLREYYFQDHNGINFISQLQKIHWQEIEQLLRYFEELFESKYNFVLDDVKFYNRRVEGLEISET